MQPRPTITSAFHAGAFQFRSVAQAYRFRPPWAAEVFSRLLELLGEEPRRVLDLGCGSGAIARVLAPLVERVDAVDISAAMVEEGRALPGGDHPTLRWIVAPAESAALEPPYGMVTAGASLHWLDWHAVLPRLHDVLTPRGRLVIVSDGQEPLPWEAELSTLIRAYSTNQEFRPLDIVAELEQRGLFRLEGRVRTAPVPFVQTIDEYIASFHGRSSFTPEHMGDERAAEFDAALHDLASRYTEREVVLQVVDGLDWGRPLRP
ncbi:MAG TPA: class I SAM-dependent methyltransferase [Dehalococcoidia bacterium]|nr:class I SAM-dependent methyltransferase [Dehalococcoidia bacterium]